MMAGETEDFISFQTEQLPTGSVSFGRFELESLSWERRSSFSHNRYLEEVERCSTPGSVTQKRAILEAHFKKKPLLPQASLENQNGCRTTECHLDRQESCSDEFEDRDDEGHPECPCYDETSGTNGHGDLERDDQKTWVSEVPADSMLCNHPSFGRPGCDEVLQDKSEHDSMASTKDDLCIVADQEPDNKAVIVEELVEKKEIVIGEEVLQTKEAIIVEQSKNPVGQKKSTTTLKKKTQKSPLKVKETVEPKSAKIKRTNRMPVEQNMRKSSHESNYISSGNMLSRSNEKLEKESTLKIKPLKLLPLRTPAPKTSDPKNLKEEVSIKVKAKVSQESNRRKEAINDKDVRAKNGGTAPHTTSGRSEVDVRRPVSRSNLVSDSTKEATKQSGAIFSFKSFARAEKRKEYFMKLEEKLHAKEVEMNEIQARTQEEKDAAVRQLRKSLNFKATPMPSFYHEAVPRDGEGKKNSTTLAKPKPQKSQSKCASLMSRTSREKSPSVPKASNHESSRSTTHAKPTEKGKKDERRKLGSGKKGELLSPATRGRTRGGAVVGGSISVAVHVAS